MNDSKLEAAAGDWGVDGRRSQLVPVWSRWLAVGLTVLSCVLYTGLFALIADYRHRVADHIAQLPIFNRIVLNIAQPFLAVFIIISVSLLVLLYVRIKISRRSYKPLLALIVVNSIFAAILLGVSLLDTNYI